MNIKLPHLIAATTAGVLLYAASKNVNPLEVVKAVITGQSLPAPGSAGKTPDLPTVNPDGTPNGGHFDSSGKYIPGGGDSGGYTYDPNMPPTKNESYTQPYPTSGYNTVSV